MKSLLNKYKFRFLNSLYSSHVSVREDNKHMNKIQKRLQYLKQQIEKECISYGEIVELQSLVKYTNDPLLLEWAGVKEDL